MKIKNDVKTFTDNNDNRVLVTNQQVRWKLFKRAQ